MRSSPQPLPCSSGRWVASAVASGFLACAADAARRADAGGRSESRRRGNAAPPGAAALLVEAMRGRAQDAAEGAAVETAAQDGRGQAPPLHPERCAVAPPPLPPPAPGRYGGDPPGSDGRRHLAGGRVDGEAGHGRIPRLSGEFDTCSGRFAPTSAQFPARAGKLAAAITSFTAAAVRRPRPRSFPRWQWSTRSPASDRRQPSTWRPCCR